MIHKMTAKGLDDRASRAVRFLDEWAVRLEAEVRKHETVFPKEGILRKTVRPPTIEIRSDDLLRLIDQMAHHAAELRQFTSPSLK